MFIALLAVLNKGCSDKVANVAIEAIGLYMNVIEYYFLDLNRIDSKLHKDEFGVHLNMIFDSLLIKVGDLN